MKELNIESVVEKFLDRAPNFEYQPISTGHINKTYFIVNDTRRFILQQLNTEVFEDLEVLMTNILQISDYLKQKNYPRKILEPLASKEQKLIVEGGWRLLVYIDDSVNFKRVHSLTQCYVAAEFLSEFHFYLRGMDVQKIKSPIKGFLDFSARESQYEDSLQKASTKRLNSAKKAIETIKANRELLEKWEAIQADLPQRIIHGDPKISNFLFDRNDLNRPIALIDWDTLMSGTILYDFGDMVRSYTHLKDEDDPTPEANFSSANFDALKRGFLFHLKDSLTPLEIESLNLAGKVIIFVQAMRFLTDYLNGDKYYSIHYPEQNLHRAQSQLNLLAELRHYLSGIADSAS